MNQAQLIAQIATVSGENKTVVENVLKTAAAIIADELLTGGEATLPGLGKFSAKDKPARKGRNPATGEEMDITAKRVPKFSAAKVLKDAVNS